VPQRLIGIADGIVKGENWGSGVLFFLNQTLYVILVRCWQQLQGKWLGTSDPTIFSGFNLLMKTGGRRSSPWSARR
jgi:hypothetical protein